MRSMAKRTIPLPKSESRLLRAERALAQAEKMAEGYGEEAPAPVRLMLVQTKAEFDRQVLLDKWGHKQGTPETYQRIDDIPPSHRQSPIDRMYEIGRITIEQQAAANEIAMVVEMIERDVGVSGASLEARVDNSGGARDVLIESMGRVRLEACYSKWRDQLPMPKRLVLDMVLSNRPLVATARVYGIPYRKARKWLIGSLDRWIDFKERVWKDVDVDEINRIYQRLGHGVPLPSRSKSNS